MKTNAERSGRKHMKKVSSERFLIAVIQCREKWENADQIVGIIIYSNIYLLWGR